MCLWLRAVADHGKAQTCDIQGLAADLLMDMPGLADPGGSGALLGRGGGASEASHILLLCACGRRLLSDRGKAQACEIQGLAADVLMDVPGLADPGGSGVLLGRGSGAPEASHNLRLWCRRLLTDHGKKQTCEI